jgi:hypothetical protein
MLHFDKCLSHKSNAINEFWGALKEIRVKKLWPIWTPFLLFVNLCHFATQCMKIEMALTLSEWTANQDQVQWKWKPRVIGYKQYSCKYGKVGIEIAHRSKGDLRVGSIIRAGV